MHDFIKVGHLMNRNHELLKELTVSCPELDNVIKIAKKAGALGAKLTGGGRGGLAVALTPGKELQKFAAKKLAMGGYATIKSRLC